MNQKGFTALGVVGIIFAGTLAIGAGFGARYMVEQNKVSQTDTTQQETEQQVPEQQISQNSGEEQATAGSTNCGSNLNCLVSAAENCLEANARAVITAPILGFFNNVSDVSFVVKSLADGTCSLYQKYNSMQVFLTSEAKADALAQGVTEAEILAQEEESTESQSFLVGKDWTCIFSDKNALADLIKIAANIQTGKEASFSFEADLFGNSAESYANSVGAQSCNGSLFAANQQ